ncbi:MAG TPA: hypothetical protein VH062_31940 [Polyangiaceae bacterium]|jgi:hypothetical protein|nr:hypothetical protein [Polyangiaceae bacterium]
MTPKGILDQISPSVLADIMARASARVSDGVVTPGAALPAAKTDFPKVLCLDTNFWIGLAQAHHGRPEGLRFGPALAAIIDATSRGKLLVPVLPTPFLEVGEVADPGRRERLARFMVTLSGNCSMWGGDLVLRAELRRAVLTQYRQEEPRTFRTRLVNGGMQAAAGVSKRAVMPDPLSQRLYDEVLRDPELSAQMLHHGFDPALASEGRELDRAGVEVFTKIKRECAGMTVAEQTRSELWNLMERGNVEAVLAGVLSELTIDAVIFNTWLRQDDHFVTFFRAVPSQDCGMTLLAERDKNRDHAPDVNDTKDFAFLDTALPYANVVATEKSWAHLAKVSGLAAKYETKITSAPDELVELLAAEGCG